MDENTSISAVPPLWRRLMTPRVFEVGDIVLLKWNRPFIVEVNQLSGRLEFSRHG